MAGKKLLKSIVIGAALAFGIFTTANVDAAKIISLS